jgi:dynein heavy chain
MKERICGRRNIPKLILKPFFEVEVKLEESVCTLKPTLDEVQRAINRAASHVLKSTKNVENWCQKNKPESERDPFYTWIARDKEIVKVILLLTGSIQGTRTAIQRFIDEFSKYDWLWKKRIDDQLRKFNSQEPSLEDFENELLRFTDYETDIQQIKNQHQIGALSLKTESVKEGLQKWIGQWKTTYAKDLHRQASSQIESLKDDMKHIRLKIEKPAEDIDSLGNVMHAL